MYSSKLRLIHIKMLPWGPMFANACNLREINELRQELAQFALETDRPFVPSTLEDINGVATDNALILAEAYWGTHYNIVGMATISPRRRLHSGPCTRIDDVVVRQGLRRLGIATKLMAYIFAHEYCQGSTVCLQSNPLREAANAFYLKVGFVRYETNVYRRPPS